MIELLWSSKALAHSWTLYHPGPLPSFFRVQGTHDAGTACRTQAIYAQVMFNHFIQQAASLAIALFRDATCTGALGLAWFARCCAHTVFELTQVCLFACFICFNCQSTESVHGCPGILCSSLFRSCFFLSYTVLHVPFVSSLLICCCEQRPDIQALFSPRLLSWPPPGRQTRQPIAQVEVSCHPTNTGTPHTPKEAVV